MCITSWETGFASSEAARVQTGPRAVQRPDTVRWLSQTYLAAASSAPDARDAVMRQASISKLGANEDTKAFRDLHGEDLDNDRRSCQIHRGLGAQRGATNQKAVAQAPLDYHARAPVPS